MSAARMSTIESQNALISIVVPCFNEEEVIVTTYQHLVCALEPLPRVEFEFVFVDDGSRDRTLELLRNLQEADRRVRVVSFSRNFGHQVAVTAGLEHTTGHAVVLIDADLQDPPEVIEELLLRWRQGADVAYGVRIRRDGETALKLWTAKIFYRCINRLSDVGIPVDTGDFRLMDRTVVDALLSMPERDRFVRGMVAWLGFRQEAVFYKRVPRPAGTTKYPFAKMVRFALDGILSFSVAPLRLAIWIGVATSAIAGVGLVYALLMRLFTNIWVPGWTLLFIACSTIGGIQLLFLGILGEYVGRIYGEVKRRPLYVVRERLGFGSAVRIAQSVPQKVSL